MAEAKVEIERPASTSPPPNCAICLGQYSNKCFSDSCMHQFCFKCLLEWSKIKAECPLCKQPFKSIIHNVKSNEEYDEHVVERTYHLPNMATPPATARHQFHFRTTFTVDTAWEHAIQEMLLSHHTHRMDGGIAFGAAGRRSRHMSTTTFRRSIYDNNLWVNAPPDVTGRYRDVSPTFFRSAPGARTRLVPWLNRELKALLYPNTQMIMHLVDMIMSCLLRHHICSRAFRNLLNEYLDRRTDHFVHEFYNFMRSPFDMFGYDRQILYSELPRSPTPYIDVSDNSDNDVIFVEESSPQAPVIIDLVNTESDEPILVSAEEPPMAPPLQVSSDEALRPPILPLKLRLKHRRQSRQKRKHRHRSSSTSSTSSSSSSSSDDSHRYYKRRRRSRKHDIYVISSDVESNEAARKPKHSDPEDNLPLATFANKKKHKKQQKKKHKHSKSSKEHSKKRETAPLELPTCSKYCSGSSSSTSRVQPDTVKNDLSQTVRFGNDKYPSWELMHSLSQDAPSCSKYVRNEATEVPPINYSLAVPCSDNGATTSSLFESSSPRMWLKAEVKSEPFNFPSSSKVPTSIWYGGACNSDSSDN